MKKSIEKIIKNNIFTKMIEKSHAESEAWRIKYQLHPRTGFPVKDREAMEAIILEYNLPYNKKFLDQVYNTVIEGVPERPVKVSKTKSKYIITGDFEKDVQEIKSLINSGTGIKWNSGKIKIEFVPVKRHNGSKGVKAICSNDKTLQNIGDMFNVGSLIKWIKE